MPNHDEIEGLLRLLVERGGSDLHLKPRRPPLLRVDGRLTPLDRPPLEPDALNAMLEALIPERLRGPMQSEMAAEFGHGIAGLSRFRASVFVQRGTLAGVFRRVPIDFPGLDDWALPEVLGAFGKLPQGLVLITGPTGSGKSSTLAALLRSITTSRLAHVLTIEDPIEFLIRDDLATVTQREVGTDTPSFAVALRNALRQDPDVLMVGEMRDPETIQTVLTAAETGHLVLSTMHTNNAVQTIDRILDSFPARNHDQVRQQLASVLEAVVSLRLVPRARGEGLVAAVEIMRRTPRVSKLIQEGRLEALEEEIAGSVAYHHMQSLDQSLAALVLHEVIDREAALAVSLNPGDLDLILRKFLFAASGEQHDGAPMPDSLSDFSKIQELQEVKRLYDELQERHRSDLAERDGELDRLRQVLDQHDAARPAADERIRELESENERLGNQAQIVRQEYESKIERLHERIRELSGGTAKAATAAAPDRRGFFRR